ncbi:MAG TPA: hypothetical protein ENN55_05400 [Firmicutes bacterium]|nr:hypothetical protein [Bacillota bacterium]
MACESFEVNMKNCNCSYGSCSRKGKCCECLHYHRKAGELPACFFPDDVEKTYDRSIKRFIECGK